MHACLLHRALQLSYSRFPLPFSDPDACGIGTNSTNGRVPCEPCPVNTFADGQGLIECKPCPEGTTTLGIGGEIEGTGAWDQFDCRSK